MIKLWDLAVLAIFGLPSIVIVLSITAGLIFKFFDTEEPKK